MLFPILSMTLSREKEHMHPLSQRGDPPRVRYFEDECPLDVDSVEQISTLQANYLPVGEVLMVRSENVPQFGDHFAVITGPLENKEHGVRPQTASISISPRGINLLDLFEPRTGVIILKLKPAMRDKFHEFHRVQVKGKEFHCSSIND